MSSHVQALVEGAHQTQMAAFLVLLRAKVSNMLDASVHVVGS
jgi:hypothetical protein